jgi:hypothetical protein
MDDSTLGRACGKASDIVGDALKEPSCQVLMSKGCEFIVGVAVFYNNDSTSKALTKRAHGRGHRRSSDLHELYHKQHDCHALRVN